MRQLDESTYVAGQIWPDDVAEAAAQGVTMIVNNRPDDEEAGQPEGAEIAAAARAAGVEYRFVPVSSGISEAQIAAMAEALEAAEGKVLAYLPFGDALDLFMGAGAGTDGRDRGVAGGQGGRGRLRSRSNQRLSRPKLNFGVRRARYAPGGSVIRGILDELKKRSVVRVAGLYAVGGWAVFQVVNALFPALGLDPWLVRAAALIFLAGFPVAIALAWMFEITPEGIKLVPGAQRQRFGRGKFGWIDWTIAAVVVAVFAFSIAQLANLRNSNGEGIGSAFANVPAKSVAVLPFASFSEVPGDGFFADGLTEEVINSLAQSPDLKVAGRTSSFYFKGRNLDLREVGRKLGVAHVVEGSVRRSGDTLRVTAQLIKVDDGFHLWSQTFDRDVDDALAIQTEVADAVAAESEVEARGP